jgi:hypothetical protein
MTPQLTNPFPDTYPHRVADDCGWIHNILFNAKVMLHYDDESKRHKWDFCPVDLVYRFRDNLKKAKVSIDVTEIIDLVQDIQCPDWKETVTFERIESATILLLKVRRENNRIHHDILFPDRGDRW